MVVLGGAARCLGACASECEGKETLPKNIPIYYEASTEPFWAFWEEATAWTKNWITWAFGLML